MGHLYSLFFPETLIYWGKYSKKASEHLIPYFNRSGCVDWCIRLYTTVNTVQHADLYFIWRYFKKTFNTERGLFCTIWHHSNVTISERVLHEIMILPLQCLTSSAERPADPIKLKALKSDHSYYAIKYLKRPEKSHTQKSLNPPETIHKPLGPSLERHFKTNSLHYS